MIANRVRAVFCAGLAMMLAGCGSSTVQLPSEPVDSSNPSEDTSGDSGAPDTGGGGDSTPADGTSSDTTPPSDTSPSDIGADVPSCVAPKKTCGGACVDPLTDSANCGDCGKACSAGTSCTLGICECPSTKIICGTACVDVSSDPANCGACGKACATGAACVSGTCAACPSTKPTVCGSAPGACTDTASDPANCGTCGKSCVTGSTCKSGLCTCPAGLVDCGSACKDVSSDVTACGSCGTKCADGQLCVSGTCACPSTKPSLCSGVCLDTTSDAKNCGACGFSCGGGSCVSGACTCGSSLTKCSGTCVDTSSDPSNCGGCGTLCAAPGKCAGGTCVLPKCRTTAPNVLFYGVTGSMEKPYLPSGTTSTVATDASWRAMTKADFAKYDLVIIGEPDGTGGGPTAADLLAAYETRSVWGPAITGRIVVFGLDPAYHAGLGTTGASTVLKASLSWLSGGPTGGTSLYVSSDWGLRSLDFLGYFGAFSSSGVYANTITITSSSHPIMIGSTSTSLSSWSNSAHSFLTLPSGFTSVATGTDTFSTPSTGPVAGVRDAACTP